MPSLEVSEALFALTMLIQGVLAAGAGHQRHQRYLLESNSSLLIATMNGTLANSTDMNGTTNGTYPPPPKQNIITKEIGSLKKGKAEMVVVAILCSLVMIAIIGCVVMWYVKRFGAVKLQLPAFLRRRRNLDKFSRYEDAAFDGEGDRF